ncbi:EAL domain-containing protein [Azoarcus sp. L1K30]|uniref:bifunctional diguanylate cyclase/phosphodiesterase n=1 Tax=Azoarcus sp. L1K30 TaxID=2820277 RepID=UPI001B82009B|nr:EAL domain-containing protein [Azoarcus sp. L1K30]MBR0567438.1 EAL domain-containing protein [Azoarcus sp. L1K30]
MSVLHTFHRHSLRTRITAFTLVIFVVSIWSLTIYAHRTLRHDVQALLGQQLLSAATVAASALDRHLVGQVNMLHRVSALITPDLLHDATALQNFLDQRLILDGAFNDGVIVLDAAGTVIAELPVTAGRLGLNYIDSDYVREALRQREPVIGHPVIGKRPVAPAFGIAAPIHDDNGTIRGVLVGVTNLDAGSFLDRVPELSSVNAGQYLVFTPDSGLIVTATDKRRIMQHLDAAKGDAYRRRALAGYEGVSVLVDSHGEEQLVAMKRIPASGWHLALSLSAADAFAPIGDMHERVIVASLLMTALAAGAIWWMLARQLSPILGTIDELASKSDTGPLRLPPGKDEIGQLVRAFNHVLEALADKEASLRQSEERYHTAFVTSPDAININRLVDGCYLDVNEGFTRLTGWTREEAVGRSSLELNVWRNVEDRRRLRDILEEKGYCENLEADFLARDGRIIPALMSAHLIEVDGEQCILSVTRDISARKAAETQLRKLSMAVEQSPASIMITDTEARIEYVNQAFMQNAGYTLEEVVGRNPRFLQSGETPAATYTAMWSTLSQAALWKGEFHNRRKDGSTYIENVLIAPICDAHGQVTNYVAVKEDITARKAAEEKVIRLAFYDPLTGLPNRRMLIDRLQQAIASGSRRHCEGALLFIDLDNFKTLNDTLGHDTGDQLLLQVGQRLQVCVRETDSVARLGGDEFVVMLEDLGEEHTQAAVQARQIAEKILTVLREPYQLGNNKHHSTPSIGVALFGRERESVEELLKRADLAMYQAKAEGRNTLSFFDPVVQAAIANRAELEASLHEALTREQFCLFYQPQVVEDGRVTGAEALLRWLHPERGIVGPEQFISLAEETGLIVPLGRWVLRTACTRLAAWARHPALAGLSIAVNVSVVQFRQAGFVDEVLAIIDETGARPELLKLELTESLLVDKVDDVSAKMSALKARGVGFSLDDFGTGFSSLVYLKRLPLDQLKIDQGFVRDILTDHNDAAIAKMVVALGESMGLSVIAEGVESDAQRQFLVANGCHAFQGYLFGRPVEVEVFERACLTKRPPLQGEG